MAIKSRADQVREIESLLEKYMDEEWTTKELASAFVDGMYDMWTRDMESPAMVPNVGVAFKMPTVSKVYFVGWIGDMWSSESTQRVAWCFSSDSDYGFFLPVESDSWKLAVESRSKVPANLKGWQIGDKVSLFQRAHHLTVVALGAKGVLMQRDGTPILQADSNTNLEKYYRREK